MSNGDVAPPARLVPSDEFEAPLSEKLAWERYKQGLPVVRFDPLAPEALHRLAAAINVAFPGQAAVNAPLAGGRQAAPGRHNWIPTGPRNVGGRVRALAVDPTDPNVLYAGAASGGVHKSLDNGETWFPLWHDEPSLAIGAIAVAPSNPSVVYAGTGEIQTGGSEEIPGAGVARSADAGRNWSAPVLPASGAHRLIKVEALAVHPTNPDICWAVGPAGAFRTMNGGAGWDAFDAGVYYSDLAWSPNPNRVFFVRAAALYTPPPNPANPIGPGNLDSAEAFVLRIDVAADPTVATVTAAFAAANSRSRTFLERPAANRNQRAVWPARGKFAQCRGTPGTAYVRLASGEGKHVGIWRTDNAMAANAAAIVWQQLPDHPTDWAHESQGTYNLSLAVDPADPANVVTGMVELYLSRNADATPVAGVTWLRAMAQDLFVLDRAHHVDNHQALFVPQPGAPAGTPPALWVANDGGISRSLDWRTGAAYRDRRDAAGAHQPVVLPLPANAITWRKRSHGISAGQMYDLTQSPVLPTAFACGFQDNGVFVTTGGDTWQLVLGADGGFVAFDPVDPYRFLVTWVGGIDGAGNYVGGINDVSFAGRIGEQLPPPGFPVNSFLWPRALGLGFLPNDGLRPVADTVHHPQRPHRILYTRLNRLYGTRDGETWSPEPVGRCIELQYQPAPPAVGAHIEVLPTPGSLRLGFRPQCHANLPVGGPARAHGTLPEPFALNAGDELHFRLDGGAVRRVRFIAGAIIPNLAAATAAQVAAFVNSQGVANVTALPRFPAPGRVELTTTTRGAGSSLTLDGSAAPLLGAEARAYNGAADQPASVILWIAGVDLRPPAAGPHTLTIRVNGGAVRTVTFGAGFPDRAKVAATELAAAINTELGRDAAVALPIDVAKTVLLTATAAPGLTIGGTALPALGGTPGGPHGGVRFLDSRPHLNTSAFDLTPVVAGTPLTLTLNDGVNPVLAVNFTVGPDLVALTGVTVDEVVRIIRAAIAGAGPLNVRCDLELYPNLGEPTEIAYGRDQPDTVMVGASDGSLYRSTDDGRQWQDVTDRAAWKHDRPVEAIAIHPRDHRTAYVGLLGQAKGAADPGFLFKTSDGGTRWAHVGAGGAGVRDGAGALVGIHAIEIDTGDPDQVFAATDVGVFRSADAGATWAPFNEGLPNVFIRDLAFAEATRTLRAGAWGRGTYARHVGPAPHRDVALYLRTSLLDDGSGRPVPSGPDALAERPREVGPFESPDIKVSPVRPAGIGADEQVDGVEFDEDIAHSEPAPGPSHVYVQVHNRGVVSALRTRLVAIWAPADAGIPPLDAGFWLSFAGGGALTLGPWTLIGDFTFTDDPPGLGRERVTVGYPRVHTFDYVWPAAVATAREIAILTLADDPQDRLDTPEIDVQRLLDTQPKVACRVTRTLGLANQSFVRFQSLGAPTFTLGAPVGGMPDARANLGLPLAGGAVDDVMGGPGPYVLSAGAPQAINVAATYAVTITFVQGGAVGPANLGAVTSAEADALLRHTFREHEVPLSAYHGVDGAGNSRFVIQIPNLPLVASPPRFRITGGTARAALGLALSPAAGVTRVNSGIAPFPLSAAAGVAQPATLTLTLTVAADIALNQGAADIPILGAASPSDVARTVNRQLLNNFLPVVCRVGAVLPRVHRSPTGAGDTLLRLGGGHLADLVVEPVAVPAGPGRAALFELLRTYGRDLLTPAQDNFLYLRLHNEGGADHQGARLRLFRLDLGAQPITAQAIGGGPKNIDCPASASVVEEFVWNPGGIAAGSHEIVLAVADDPAAPLAVPADFPDFEAVDAFCARHPGAAYRVLTAGP